MSETGESRIISDRYSVEESLGSGGMGTVWRATDQLLRRTVAMKEMRLHSRGEELAKQTQRAHREARALAQISHPHVINVYDLVAHDEGVWLVMELVDGPSLAEHVVAAGPLAPRTVAEVGLQLLAALEAVHAAGTLHRDVKPGNVLLRADGSAVLCDFGIAALAGTDSVTTTRGVVGSPEYIAPERLTRQPVGPPSDLFSLGGTLCTLLSGSSPFARSEAIAVLHAVAHEHPDLPAEAVAGPLRPLLEALLRKDPAERPSVAEAMEILRTVAATATGQSAPEPVVPPGQGGSGPVTSPGPGVPEPPHHTPESVGASADTADPRAGAASRRQRLTRRAALSAALLAVGGGVTGLLVNRATEDGEEAGAQQEPSGTTDKEGKDSAAPAHSTRIGAVMPTPGDPDAAASNEYWLFVGDAYLRVLTSAGSPVRERLTDLSPLTRWSGTLGRLPGFRDGVDAALRVPDKTDEYWVFRRERYVRIRIGAGYEDTLLGGPEPLRDWVPAFGDLATGPIDAVMPVPDDPEQLWVFSGKEYVRARLAGEGPGGKVEQGPAGLHAWQHSLGRTPGFREGIDAVLPVPGERNHYWVFAGRKHLKMGVTDVDYADSVLREPRTLRSWDEIRRRDP